MVCPLYRECPLLRESNCIILIGGLKFGDLVLSIVERDLIQCPLFGVSVKRESTDFKGLWQDFVQFLCQTKNNSIDGMITVKEMVTKFS